MVEVLTTGERERTCEDGCMAHWHTHTHTHTHTHMHLHSYI